MLALVRSRSVSSDLHASIFMRSGAPSEGHDDSARGTERSGRSGRPSPPQRASNRAGVSRRRAGAPNEATVLGVGPGLPGDAVERAHGVRRGPRQAWAGAPSEATVLGVG